MSTEAVEHSEHLKLIMESMEEHAEEHRDRFKIVVAMLLGLVTILGGFVAWRVAVAYEHAGVTDLTGLAATINAEQTRAVDTASLYEHLRAFTSYVHYTALAQALSSDLKGASPDQTAPLQDQQAQDAALATQNQDFFPKRYLNRDGTYDSPLELGEAWSDAAREHDINPALHFTAADTLRQKTSLLFGTLVLLAGALWWYTLAEVLDNRLRYAAGALGFLLTLGAVLALILIEVLL